MFWQNQCKKNKAGQQKTGLLGELKKLGMAQSVELARNKEYLPEKKQRAKPVAPVIAKSAENNLSEILNFGF